MKNMMKYKGYYGSVEFSEEDGVFYGKVQGIQALLSYEGENEKELISDFHEAVDGYLEYCKEEKLTPEKAFTGSFTVTIPAGLHREACFFAFDKKLTLNELVEEAIKSYLKAR